MPGQHVVTVVTELGASGKVFDSVGAKLDVTGVELVATGVELNAAGAELDATGTELDAKLDTAGIELDTLVIEGIVGMTVSDLFVGCTVLLSVGGCVPA